MAERRRRSGCWPPGAGLSCRPVIGQVGVTEDPGAQSALTGRGAGDARRCACGPAEWLVGVGAALALKKRQGPTSRVARTITSNESVVSHSLPQVTVCNHPTSGQASVFV